MDSETIDFSEDDTILAQLEDPVDVEAFRNLMENAHRDGVSAADFVREDPKRTSRKAIRRLCLHDRKRSIRAMVSGVVKSLWDRPVRHPEDALVQGLFGRSGHPPQFGPQERKKDQGS